jgi:stearoyl-CoA desaturase (delta-9 desaturase)
LKISNFNWGPGLFILGYHLFLLISIPMYFFHCHASWGLIAISALLVYVTGMSVTAGYHRLYSHTTYKINPVVEAILLFFATMAVQGSALRWTYDHRKHHAYVDTDRDPYSIKKGFWYAHFLWLFEKPKEIENKVVSDLLRKPLLRFQHRLYAPLMFLTNGLIFLFVGWCFNDYLGAFFFACLLRMFCLHHLTWFINSLAHTWGARTFCQELSAVDNYMISLLTFGEGYHNYHHTFAYDYRNGVRWYHFDPTKWLIWTLSKLGLAYQLKKNQYYFIEQRVILERKELLLERIRSTFGDYKKVWEEKITTLTDSILTKLKEIKQLREDYRQLKKSKERKQEYLHALRLQIKAIKKGLKEEYKRCKIFSREVMAFSASMYQSEGKAPQAIPTEE